MTYLELMNEYGVVIFARGFDPNAEVAPEFEQLLKDFLDIKDEPEETAD